MNLWDHQRRAVEECRGRDASMLDMGLGCGKTCVALALAEEWDCKRVLVLCTKSGIDVWPHLLRKHLDSAPLWRIAAERGKTCAKRAKTIARELEVCAKTGLRLLAVVNYQAAIMPPLEELLCQTTWDLIVLDEVHRIKQNDGRQSLLARRLCRNAPHRLGLTGTMMPNSPLDPWAQFAALDPTVLGDSFVLYKRRFCVEKPGVTRAPARAPRGGEEALLERAAAAVPGGQGLGAWLTQRIWGGASLDDLASVLGVRRNDLWTLLPVLGLRLFTRVDGFQNQEEFRQRIAPVTFSCLTDEVLDLPEKTYLTRTCDLGAEARRLYDAMESNLRVELARGEVTAANAMTKGLRLQQIANGHLPVEGRSERFDAAKRDLLQEVLEDLQPPFGEERGEAVVVFCRFVGNEGAGDLDAAHEAARKAGHKSVELSGRRNELKVWQGGEANVLVVQIQAGSESVDLTRSRYAIYYSGDWSLGNREQSEARVRRPGQTRPVFYVDLVASGTVDEDIALALQRKTGVVEGFLDGLRRRGRGKGDADRCD